MPVTRVCTNATYAKSRGCPPLPGGKTHEPGLFPGSAQEGCELREPPLRPRARLRFATPCQWCRSMAPGVARRGPGDCPPRGRAASAAMTASFVRTCCARWRSRSPARRSGPTARRACGRLSRCTSSSARSAAAKPRGRSRAPRSRPRCTPEPRSDARPIQSARGVDAEGSVRVTVLGKSPSWQDTDGACSGYLIEEAGVLLLLDCGNGVFGKLRRFADYVEIDAVVISHLHADHFLDLVPFSYALKYAPRQQPVPVGGWPGTDHPARPALHVPDGGRDVFRRVVGAWGSEDLVETAFELREYRPDHVLEVGPLRVRFQEVPQFPQTYAVEIAADGAGRLTYGADHSPTDDLIDFARGTDLLLIEATLPQPEPEGPRGHLTPAEAGEHGRRAEARRLVLTHISDELDAEWARSEAERAFGGSVEIAREGAAYTV